ncbi:MAG: hypothetical protein V9F06_09730 [Thermomicrobiales bacterium]
MLRILLLAVGVVVAVSLMPIQSTQPSTFADPAFTRYFQRTGTQGRALLWGQGPIVSIVEPFTGAPGNRRLVEYFERGRMELATEAEDGASRVTVGLLVREMATGNVQVGYDAFVQVAPAAVPIFSAMPGLPADQVTYANFADDARSHTADRTGAEVDAWMTSSGATEQIGPERVILGRYDPQTGHNVPAITDGWLAAAPLGALSPLEAVGRPISEPYWIDSGKGPIGLSLVQLFERRAIVYTPGLPEGERFTVTSAGRHYYQWRYSAELTPAAPAAPTRSSFSQLLPGGDLKGLTTPDGFKSERLDVNVTDVVDIAVGPDGRVALLRSGGRVDLYDPRSGSVAAEPFVDHLVNPIALAWSGTSLYIADDRGVYRYEDARLDGRPNQSSPVVSGAMSRPTVALGAGPEASVVVLGRPLSPGGTPEAADAARLLRIIDGKGDLLRAEDLPGGSGPMLVAPDGSVWFVGADRQLSSFDPATGDVTARIDLSSLGANASVVRLMLYRADGTAGATASDILAVVRDGDSGARLVRLLPADQPRLAVPAGAVVEFASGFDRPVAAASGLDGSLYVLDAGRDALYVIRPSR